MPNTAYSKTLTENTASLWRGGSPLLGQLDMELTERCILDCVHCCINLPAADREAKARELSTEKIEGILTEAASLGCLAVRFTGGEPLLRKDFEELYIFARKLGMKVLIFTNATLITRRLAELFARIPPLEKIEITVYGMKKESYEAVTKTSGSFEAAWRGMNLLLENRAPFVVKGAFLPPNKAELKDFESWASTIPGMDRPPPYSAFFSLRCRRGPQEKNRQIEHLRLSPEEGLRFLTRRQREYVDDMKQFCHKFMSPPGDDLFSCSAGVGGGCVDAYGRFQPCMMLRHPDTVYDLKNGSLKDALTSFFPRMRKAKATNADYLYRCARCFLRGLCEQCPARSWEEHGALDIPVDYFCEVAHAQAVYLGLLQEGEEAWTVNNWKERIRNFSTSA